MILLLLVLLLLLYYYYYIIITILLLLYYYYYYYYYYDNSYGRLRRRNWSDMIITPQTHANVVLWMKIESGIKES